MPSFKEKFTPEEIQELVKIARVFGLGEASGRAGHPNHVSFLNMLREASGDDDIGRNPVLGNTALEKIGGFVLKHLLGALVKVCAENEKLREIIKDIQEKKSARRGEVVNTTVDIVEALEEIEKGNGHKLADILGNMLYEKEDLSL